MKKILIYLNKNNLVNSGGAEGYNYNLKKGLDVVNNKYNINYLSCDNSNSNVAQATKKIKKIQNKFFYALLKGIRDLFRYISIIFSKKTAIVDLKEYDCVHFHDTFDMYKCKNSLKNYSGKVILTTHSPLMPYKERLNGIPKFIKYLFFPVFFYSKNFDVYAIKRADFIVAPNEFATESYKKSWGKYDTYALNKTKYLLTGIYGDDELKSRLEICQKYNISNDKFLVAFLGRHDKVKGYDSLSRVAINLQNFKNIHFVIGGNIKPLYPPTIDTWSELGYVNDSRDVMHAADVYVSANSDTYFDLSLLQALSSGTIILARNVGGNKYFSSIAAKGVILFNSDDELYDKLIELSKYSNDKLKELRQLNKSLFDTYFNHVTFANNYILVLDSILDNS